MAPSPRPSEARRVRLGPPPPHPLPTQHSPQGAGEGRPPSPRWLLSLRTQRPRGLGQAQLPGRTLLRAKCPGPWLASLPRLREEHLQPSDPGRERLGKVRQPQAAAVQQVSEAAAGSGAPALGGDPPAGARGRARASQQRAQQQPQRRRGRPELRRAHRGPAASRPALRPEPRTDFQPRVMPAPRTACARPPLALPGELLSFTLHGEAFSCTGAAWGQPKRRAPCGRGAGRAASARRSPSHPQKKLSGRLPAAERPVPARRSRGRGERRPARAHWPARPRPRDNNRAASPGRERRRKWSWGCRKFGVTFSSLSGQKFHYILGSIYQMALESRR